MAEHFTVVEGKHPQTGEDVKPVLSTKEIDQIEALLDVKPLTGQLYKKSRHVVRVSCVRGVVPRDGEYARTLAYTDKNIPQVCYIDMVTKEMKAISPIEFAEWLGKTWEAEDAPETEETKASNAALEAAGNRIRTERDEKYKEAPPSDKIKRPTPPKSKRHSKR